MRKEVIILAAIVLVVIIAILVGSNYYRNSLQNERVGTKTNGNSNKAAINPEMLVRPDSYSLGAADAPVTLVEFFDPECEACAAFNPVLKKLLKDYEGRIRLVARYMPLHPSSVTAATFTEAAGEQGKYWQAQDLLFRRQSEWGQKHGQPAADAADIDSLFDKYAQELGLDLEKLDQAITSRRFEQKINRDRMDGQTLGVRQTPTIFVNGRQLLGMDERQLRSMIDEELRK